MNSPGNGIFYLEVGRAERGKGDWPSLMLSWISDPIAASWMGPDSMFPTAGNTPGYT